MILPQEFILNLVAPAIRAAIMFTLQPDIDEEGCGAVFADAFAAMLDDATP